MVRKIQAVALWLLILAVWAAPASLVWARLGILAAVLLLGMLVPAAAAYRRFCATCGSLFLAGFLVRHLTGQTTGRGFEHRMIVTGAQHLAIALAVLLVASQLCGRKPEAIYLRIGDLRAKLAPPWFRIAGLPVRWRLAAPVIAVASAVCVKLFLASAGQSGSFDWRLLLWAVALAANNAFVEEAIYRSALIASLQADFGPLQAVAASAAIFGLAHWNGILSGFTGVLMASAFGLLAAKAMLETKGLFWPWFMHVLPDVVIYYQWGAGAITASAANS